MKPRILSTSQLAKLCGVSQGTVDRALNDRPGISPQTKKRILDTAKAYGYRPNIHARSISGGKSMLLGVVVFDIHNEYFSELLMGIEETCRQRGYSAVVMFTHKDPERELACIDSLYRMYMDGIILCPVNRGEDFEKYLHSLEIPVVTVGNRLDTFPHIGIDDYAAMAEVVRKAAEKGYRQLLYPCPPLDPAQNTWAQSRRLEGFLDASKALGLRHRVLTWQQLPDLPDTPEKTAVICPTDRYALRLLSTAKSRGWGLTGFDDLRLIDTLGLCLDSVGYDLPAATDAAAVFLERGLSGDILIPWKYVDRGSL